MHLGYVHSYRAVAILIVVAGHAIANFSWAADPVTRSVLLDLLDNGSVLFVFLSGFLFAHHAERFRYWSYLGRRFVGVVLPYLVLSAPAVAYDVLHSDASLKYPEQLTGSSPLYQAMWFLVRGSVVINYALWFVPMIALYYLASPLFAFLARHPRLYVVLVVLLPLSLLMHRTSELDTVSMAFYFLAAYVAGMWASHIRPWLEPWLLRLWPWLLILFAVATGALAITSDHHGNYAGAYPFSQEHGLVDWMFAQKLLLCFGLLALMLRVHAVVGEGLRHVADISVTIFLLHVYVLYVVFLVERHVVGIPVGSVGGVLAMTGVTVALIAGGTLVTQRLFGHRSRYLIGS
jgi:surface polysaccharide O-acyltransferase-like enzyme